MPARRERALPVRAGQFARNAARRLRQAVRAGRADRRLLQHPAAALRRHDRQGLEGASRGRRAGAGLAGGSRPVPARRRHSRPVLCVRLDDDHRSLRHHAGRSRLGFVAGQPRIRRHLGHLRARPVALDPDHLAGAEPYDERPAGVRSAAARRHGRAGGNRPVGDVPPVRARHAPAGRLGRALYAHLLARRRSQCDLRAARRLGAQSLRTGCAAGLPLSVGEATRQAMPALPSDARAGLFGKLPARGDFVRENLPRDFTDSMGCLVAARPGRNAAAAARGVATPPGWRLRSGVSSCRPGCAARMACWGCGCRASTRSDAIRR